MEAEKTEKIDTTTEQPVPAEGEHPADGTEGGAKLSKNEQKRLEKQKKLEAEKAAKLAKKAEENKDKPATTKSAKPEEILDPTQYF